MGGARGEAGGELGGKRAARAGGAISCLGSPGCSRERCEEGLLGQTEGASVCPRKWTKQARYGSNLWPRRDQFSLRAPWPGFEPGTLGPCRAEAKQRNTRLKWNYGHWASGPDIGSNDLIFRGPPRQFMVRNCYHNAAALDLVLRCIFGPNDRIFGATLRNLGPKSTISPHRKSTISRRNHQERHAPAPSTT